MLLIFRVSEINYIEDDSDFISALMYELVSVWNDNQRVLAEENMSDIAYALGIDNEEKADWTWKGKIYDRVELFSTEGFPIDISSGDPHNSNMKLLHSFDVPDTETIN